MSVDWDAIAHQWQQEQPHPLEPALKIGEFATAVKLASALKFGGHATPAEAALFWPQFLSLQITPETFEHMLERLAPLSFTYHGRPPSLQEIAQLKDKQPHEARRYFADLPDKTFPHVTAGEMVAALRAADPHAQEHLGRSAVPYEGQYLHHSKENPREFYMRLGAQRQDSEPTISADNNVLPIKVGPDATGRGVAAPGGPSADQRASHR